jgi:hypothetical protein
MTATRISIHVRTVGPASWPAIGWTPLVLWNAEKRSDDLGRSC